MMNVIRKFRTWRIRKQLQRTMLDLVSIRKRMEQTKKMTDRFVLQCNAGADGKEFRHALCQSINHLSDAIDLLRPHSPVRSLVEVIDQIQELAKVERVLMARKFRKGEDSAAKG